MFVRRSFLGILGAASIAVAACATPGSNSTPSTSMPPATEAASGSPAAIVLEMASDDARSAAPSEVPDLPAFCAEVAGRLSGSWPDLGSNAAVYLGSTMNDWAMKPEVAVLQDDLATIAMWLLGSAGATATPPSDVHAAVDHLKRFALANC